MQFAELQILLDAHGLLAQGSLEYGGETLVLVGNAGSRLWPVFTESPEYRDGRPDPLDRWCRRIGNRLAEETGAKVIFPFDGPPYPPFLDWAAQAGIAFPSPVSMFVHPRYGLWHAFRFALLLDRPLEGLPGKKSGSSCLSCPDQPCLEACPVDAFDDGVYRVGDCLGYLGLDPDSSCRTSGCAARRACPVGRAFIYEPGHAQFHMNAFIAAQSAGSTADVQPVC
jgi:hypothetical protein